MDLWHQEQQLLLFLCKHYQKPHRRKKEFSDAVLTFLSACHLHYACDCDHVPWDTAVHQILDQLALDGAWDPSRFPLLVRHQLLHPATHQGELGTMQHLQPHTAGCHAAPSSAAAAHSTCSSGHLFQATHH